MKEIFNFAFIDLETTGLPLFEHNKTRITELSLTIVESQHLSLGVYPRVRNKLHLCLNPCKLISPDATKVTKLSNDILENQPCFSSDIADTIKNFLNLNKKPICLVAHNGTKFDYPILKAELDKVNSALPNDIYCIDSLECFRDLHEKSLKIECENPIDTLPKTSTDEEPLDEIDNLLCAAMDEYERQLEMSEAQKRNETTPKKQIIYTQSRKNIERTSFKLCDIYKRLISKEPLNSHDAEGDVESMIYCAAHYGEKFVDWANNNAKLFSNILPMRPGIPLWRPAK